MNNEQFTQHQFQGSQRISLFGLPLNVNTVPDDTPFFDIRLDNVSHLSCFYVCVIFSVYLAFQVTVPPRETTYFCVLMELPKIFRNRTHYILKVKLVISTGSHQLEYHNIITVCSSDHSHKSSLCSSHASLPV